MNEEKKKTGSVTGRGLFIILFTLMIASTAWACKIGDFVWYDVDKDGVQDTGEAGVVGVIVTAYDCDTHEQMGTATTDEYGLYEIAWPSIPQPFYLVFVLPDEMVQSFAFTTQNKGGNDGLDSDVDALGWTECFEWPKTYPWIREIWDFDAGIVEMQQTEPCGACQGKLTQLTLRYHGTAGATIKVIQKKGEVVFDDYVGPQETFTFDGTDRNGTLGTEISIYVDGEPNAKIHTSCSQPIGPGLVRGDFEVVEGYSKDGGRLCPMPDCGRCDGKVTRLKLKYEGPLITDIMVVQKKGITVVENVDPGDEFTIAGLDKNGTLGSEISIHVGDDPVPTEIHTSCSQPIGPGMRLGPFLIVEGHSLKGGRLCPAESLSQSCGCEGKVTRLTLQYNGAFAQPVVILQKKSDDPVFDDYVEPGAQITFSGHDRNGTLGTEISVYVGEDAELNTKIHTSCSQPIGPGLVFGDFEVIEGYSLKGGPLCPLGKDN